MTCSASDVGRTLRDVRQILQLQTWLSPAFPTGSFGYSQGLETAIECGWVRDAADCRRWLRDVLEFGNPWNDALLLCSAWRACREADVEALRQVNGVAISLATSRERLEESLAQGEAFLAASTPWLDEVQIARRQGHGPDEWTLPVAIGTVTASLSVPLPAIVAAAVQASLSNLVWIAARLLPMGQTAALATIESFEEPVVTLADRAAVAELDRLRSGTPGADIAAMRHRYLDGRTCRS